MTKHETPLALAQAGNLDAWWAPRRPLSQSQLALATVLALAKGESLTFLGPPKIHKIIGKV